MANMLKSVEERVREQAEKIDHIQRLLEQVSARQRAPRDRLSGMRLTKHAIDTAIVVIIVLFVQFIMRFIWKGSSTHKEL